jgi:AN1-type zinc finger and ubiquitin domain-containing protein 1
MEENLETKKNENFDYDGEKQTTLNCCEICNKKVNLTLFQCKCKKMLCKNHVFVGAHLCEFDYKTETKKILQKQLIKIKSSKIDRI